VQPVIDAPRPPFDIREHLADPRQHLMGGHGADDVGVVVVDGDAGVFSPTIGLGGWPRRCFGAVNSFSLSAP
jgi:hypothetical protein